MVEHIATHLRLHPHAHHVSLVLDEVVEQHTHEIEQKEPNSKDDDHAVLTVGNEIVEHRARHHGVDHADERHDQRCEHIQRKQLFVWLVVA